MNRPQIVITFLLISTIASADKVDCNDSEYSQFLEELNCTIILTEFGFFLESAKERLSVNHPSHPEQREELLTLVSNLEDQESLIQHCVVKHAQPDGDRGLVEIYMSATSAVLSLRRWISSRPNDEFFEVRARSKFDELVDAMEQYSHNKAFNTDAGKACAG